MSSFRALVAPLLIDSYALQDRVVRSSLIGQMLGGLRPLWLAESCVWPALVLMTYWAGVSASDRLFLSGPNTTTWRTPTCHLQM